MQDDGCSNPDRNRAFLWNTTAPSDLDGIALPDRIINPARLILYTIQHAQSLEASGTALARADGFIVGLESAGLVSADLQRMRLIFEAAAAARRAQIGDEA